MAARWTWLQAQVSDLEYRIRQQSEIHRQIRQKKGEVKLGEAPICSTSKDSRLEMLHQSNMSPVAVTPIMSNMDKQSEHLKHQLGNIYTPSPVQSPGGVATRESESITPNGLLSSSSLSNRSLTTNSNTISSSEVTPTSTNSGESVFSESSCMDATCVAARCRPTILGKYRKRKLLRTSSLHTRNRKCARLSSVRCKCYPPVTPCAMCGGRYNNTRDVEQDACQVNDNIALLDHSYHQVLSLHEGSYAEQKSFTATCIRVASDHGTHLMIIHCMLTDRSRCATVTAIRWNAEDRPMAGTHADKI